VAAWGLLGVVAGMPLVLFGRWRAWKSAGWVLAGLGLMFFGMQLMTAGAEPVRSSPAAGAFLAGLARHPLLAALAGAGLTAAIQSSGAAVALVMTMAGAGALAPESLLPMVAGINVGACAPAVVAAAGAGREGRRLAVAYVGFKVLGAALVLPFAGVLGRLGLEATAAAGGGAARAVANLHTAYNLGLALVFLVPAGRLAAIFARLVPARAGRIEQIAGRVSAELAGAGAGALAAAGRELAEMGRRTAVLLREGLLALEQGGGRRIESLKALDDEVDAFYLAMSRTLSRLAGQLPPGPEAAQGARLLYAAELFEEVGDLVSRDLAKLAEKRAALDAEFSMESLAALRRSGGEALRELEQVAAAAGGGEGGAGPAGAAGRRERIEAEHRALLAEHFEQLRLGVAEADATASIYPDALAVIRDVRRAAADIAAALAEGPESG